ncbi:cytochrome P450 4C1-like [Uloborus diversus]|uniref:cytochrome P450 4C1-like n=1 Tax=Uloborus diversus TaxID=327109 RepID=UPI00240A638A|nr:cytochrome P450 4C1-like [Uloborus diversus]
MSGGVYHVSVQEVVESERKVRIRSMLSVNSEGYGKIKFKSLSTSVVDESSGIPDEQSDFYFEDVLCDVQVSQRTNMLDVHIQEIHQTSLEDTRMGWTKPLVVTGVVMAIIALAEWCWWKYMVKDLQTLPSSKCNKHLVIAQRMLSSIFHNKLTDGNVLFFQLLRGLVMIHQIQNLGCFYMWGFFRPVVFCFSPEFFEVILKSPINLKKSFDYTFLHPWLKEGLVTSEGNKWRARRRVIANTFHFKILESFVGVFDDQSRYMVKKLTAARKDNPVVNVIPYITMCTLDTICQTAMGISIHAQDNHDSVYVKRMHKACEAFAARILRPWLWPDWVFYNTRRGKEFKENSAAMDKFTRQVILNRKAEMTEKLKSEKNHSKSENVLAPEGEDEKRKAFLDLLLDMHLSDPESFTEYDIQEEVDSFMFAGHDTTAVGTGWTLYLLGLHPEVQARVVEEIDSVYGDDYSKPVTEECLKQLKYLDCVIKEAQRLFPPAPYIGRELQEDVEVDGFKIPKGTTCMLVIYMLHRNKECFPNPELFDPDRFLPENINKRHPFAYCPFSAGPRSCIGQKFAMLEEKTIVSNILRNFTVRSVDQRDQLFLAAELVLRSRGGVKLELIPRKR